MAARSAVAVIERRQMSSTETEHFGCFWDMSHLMRINHDGNPASGSSKGFLPVGSGSVP